MNWEAIGAVAELLGAIGVIVSLVYLATQIRQNTRSVRSATYHGLVGVQQQAQIPVAYDSETAEIIRKGMQDSSQLSEADAFRFNWFMAGLMTNFDDAMYQLRNEMLSPDRWQVYVASLRWFLAAPGIRAWWNSYHSAHLGPDFVRLVNDEIRSLEATESPRGEVAP